MTTWEEARDRLHAENPHLKEEYDRLGPRFGAISALVDARDRQRVSQSELARRMGVQPNVVSRLEAALHSPRLDTLVQYADALGYDFTLKLTRKRNKPPATGAKPGSPQRRPVAAARPRRPPLRRGRARAAQRRAPHRSSAIAATRRAR